MMCLKYSSNRSNTLKILLNHLKNGLGLVRVVQFKSNAGKARSFIDIQILNEW